MTFAELKQDVALKLAEVAERRVFWSEEDIAEAVQLAYAELSDSTEWYETHANVVLLKNRPYYDLWSIIGDGFLSLKPSFNLQTNRWLVPSTVAELDAGDRQWERVVGQPARVLMRGLRWLAFYPRLDAEQGKVKVYHTALPPPFENEDDEPGFPEAFHPALVDFALTDLWAQDGETKLALAAWASYLEGERQLADWVQRRAALPKHHGFAGASEGSR
jgi:hypothetical protein